jgi:hypothetical protein
MEENVAKPQREDDLDEEVDESPVPDPTTKDTDASDDPQAD